MKHVLTGTLLLLALQGLPATLLAQAGDPTVASPTTTGATEEQLADAIFTSEQLEQLVAPIALYPDALLMQILMASTYPLEVVEADRWISKQPDLKGDALDQALLDKDWDPSVKSLTTLPSVLTQMSDNLDWTQDLGDAFLAQENDLLDTVQTMRGKAYEAGNLQTTEQQQVTQNPDKIIVIQQASPEIVYVPTYAPTVVYGPAWGYPSYYYPSMYPYYPPGYGLLAFGVGVAVGGAIWGNCNWGWGHNNVNINVNRYNNFNRNTNVNFDRDRVDGRPGGGRDGNNAGWKHDASHRKGVNYKSKDVAQRNGANAGSNRVTKDQARGRTTAGTTDRAGAGGQAQNRAAGAGGQAQNRAAGAGGQAQNRAAGAGGQAQNRAAGAGGQAQNRAAGAGGQAQNRAAGAGGQAQNRSAGSQGTRAPSANRSGSSGGNSAFSGSRSPSSDRMSSSRGASSRGTPSYGGSRGGGGGSGGGASRGGGGRRH